MEIKKCDKWETPLFIKKFDEMLFKETKTPKEIFEKNREKTVDQFKK